MPTIEGIMGKFQDVNDAIKAMRSPKRLLVLSESIKNRMKTLMGHKSNSDPVGHYAEWLTLQVFGGELSPSASQAGFDLVDEEKRKIQVKGRVMREGNKRRGARINKKNMDKFDYLVVVLFNSETFKIYKALGMSRKVFDNVSRVSSDSSRFSVFSDDINKEGVDDLTEKFQKVESLSGVTHTLERSLT